MRRMSVVGVSAVLAVACAGSAEEEPPTLEEALEAEAGGELREASLETEVHYGQAGGIAGRIEELRIAPDGTGELTSRGREPVPVSLDDEQLNALAVALEDANLAEQAEEQMSDPAIPDAFTFELSYDGARVLTDEFAAPDELQPALELLRGIVEDTRAAAS
ncbi:MAG: hypothetical protein WD225_04065 [Ilumatobacteraceae bacterium]